MRTSNRVTLRAAMLGIVAPIWLLALAEVITGIGRNGWSEFWSLTIAGTLFTATIATIAVTAAYRWIRQRVQALIAIGNRIAEGDTTYAPDAHLGVSASTDVLDHLEFNVLRIADALQREHNELVERSDLSFFDSKLQRGFELCQDQDEALEVVARAVREITPTSSAEVLLTDRDRQNLSHARSLSSDDGPGCPVDATGACAAVRSGNMLAFQSSDDLDACPRLRDRPEGNRSAICVPINSMGQSIGVLHLTDALGHAMPQDARGRLEVLAFQSGVRLGMLETLHYTNHEAQTDPLTGLLNRRSFEKRASALLGAGSKHVVAMCDIDHFKRLNDDFGHEAGDQALVLFAEQMRSVFREQDLLCRHGGEEFVMLLNGCSAADAPDLLDRFRATIEAYSEASPGPAFTVSIGWSSAPTQGDKLSALLRAADRGLYNAKEGGRNRVLSSNQKAIASTGNHASTG